MAPSRRARARSLLGAGLVAAALAGGCSAGGAGPAAPPGPAADPATTGAPPATAAPTTVAPPVDVSEVATVRPAAGPVAVYPSAGAAEPDRRVDAVGDYGQPQVFLVLGRAGDRLEVALPVRPNGSTGWIDAAAVEVHAHAFRIDVSLSGHRMAVSRRGEVVVETPIGVGTTDTPTPGGHYYTWVLIAPTNSGYGSYAYGLSGFSEELSTFAGGDARLGIHGTEDDASIGRDVSHGCIRVPDEVMVRLVEEIGLPLGVPVHVTA